MTTTALDLANTHGLDLVTAMKIENGDLDLAQILERREEARLAPAWHRKNRRARPVVGWDDDPARFHLALDGVSAARFRADYPDVLVLEAPTEAFHAALMEYARRLRKPFARPYASKSIDLAYRWSQGRAVTPPMVAPYGTALVFLGGNHRYNLARHYGEATVPFLAQACHEALILDILPSARRRP